jgi:hypothetical protein
VCQSLSLSLSLSHTHTHTHTHSSLAIYIKKKYLKAKEEELLCKLKYFTMQKIILFQKSSKKRNPKPSRYIIIFVTNLKFQHKPKISSFKKSSYKNKSY